MGNSLVSCFFLTHGVVRGQKLAPPSAPYVRLSVPSSKTVHFMAMVTIEH